MKKLLKTMAVAAAIANFAAAPAIAEDGTINLKSVVEKEVITVEEDGKETISFTEAKLVLPGEVVRYTNIYTNVGSVEATNLVLNNPVPEHTIYISGSAFGEETTITFSADGAKSYAPIGELKVKAEDGSERPALPAEITHIRWTRKIPLPPNGEGQVGFSARLK